MSPLFEIKDSNLSSVFQSTMDLDVFPYMARHGLAFLLPVDRYISPGIITKREITLPAESGGGGYLQLSDYPL